MTAVDDQETATRIAAEFLETEVRPGVGQEVVLTEVREFPTCWVAGYNTKAYVETGSVIHALAGGGPIIVNRRSGEVRMGTSALPAEDQLDPE